MDKLKKSREKQILDGIKFYPVIILIAFSLTTTYFMIQHNQKYLKKNIEEIKMDYFNQQKDIAVKEVNKVYSLIQSIYNKAKKENLKNIDIKSEVLQIIESFKYDIYGYIFIMDFEGNFYANVNKEFLEKNQWDLKDKDGNYVIREIIKAARDKKEFVTYNSLKGTFEDDSKKISYIKTYDSLNWIIGYGFHPSKIESDILKKQEKFSEENNAFRDNIIVMNILFTLSLAVFLFLFSKNIEDRFLRYKSALQKVNNKNRKKDELIFQQSKMASIGEMLSIISHQWRQPLSQINTVSMDMYVEHRQNSLTLERLESHIKDIESTTSYLSNTIDDFLIFFSQEKYKSKFYVREAIEGCLNILAPSLKDIDIDIKVKKDMQTYGFVSLYQQVILTIISNSLYVFNERNIQNPKIEIKILGVKSKSLVLISDNGKGIADINLPKVFNLNFSTKVDKKGSGLGLYISKKIITQSFKGSISVKNRKNGAMFKIYV